VEVKPGYKQTEVGVIPKEWHVCRLDSLGEGQTPPIKAGPFGSSLTKATYVPTGYKVYGQEQVIHGDHFYGDYFITQKKYRELESCAVRPGDVLLSLVGTVGRLLVLPENSPAGIINPRLIRFSFDKTRVSSTFFQFLFQSGHVQRSLERQMQGGTMGVLNAGALRPFCIPLPPLPEQRAIAAALGDVDALLDGLTRLIAKKRDLKHAAMQQLFTGQTRLPGFHGEWEAANLGEIAMIRNAKVVASMTPAGTQCVELEFIGQGTGRLLGSSSAAGPSTKYSFKAGDVLFGRLRPYLKKYWLATFDGVCSTEIWPLVARDDRLLGTFLYLLVQTNEFADAAGVSYGTHMPRSDWSVLAKLTVMLPSSEEQSAIAAVLSDMDTELSALEARRDKTRALKQAMMQELLTGRTRLV
jgi:type I restriction enzyme S subunit